MAIEYDNPMNRLIDEQLDADEDPYDGWARAEDGEYAAKGDPWLTEEWRLKQRMSAMHALMRPYYKYENGHGYPPFDPSTVVERDWKRVEEILDGASEVCWARTDSMTPRQLKALGVSENRQMLRLLGQYKWRAD